MKGSTGFWADLARRELHWQTPFTVTLDEIERPELPLVYRRHG